MTRFDKLLYHFNKGFIRISRATREDEPRRRVLECRPDSRGRDQRPQFPPPDPHALPSSLFSGTGKGSSACGRRALPPDEPNKGRSPITRFDKLLYHINKDGMGIEIGPSHNPVAPKKDGYRVHIIDHASQQELIEKYAAFAKDHKLNLDNIEEVDFVWKGESYVELTGRLKHYDWIIASNVIEHTPDLIGFLNECDSLLKEEGVLSLAIPDKRFCFDHFRPLSGIAKVIDSHITKQKTHSPGTAAEHILSAVNRDGTIAWSHGNQGNYRLHHSSLVECIQMMELTSQGQYVDFHAWCFTPSSFRLLIHDMYLLGLVSLQEVSFFPTEAFEFYVTLGHPKEKIRFDRLAMLKMVESELAIAS